MMLERYGDRVRHLVDQEEVVELFMHKAICEREEDDEDVEIIDVIMFLLDENPFVKIRFESDWVFRMKLLTFAKSRRLCSKCDEASHAEWEKNLEPIVDGK